MGGQYRFRPFEIIRQTRVMNFKNRVLFVRNFKFSALQLLGPAVFMLLLFILQNISVANNDVYNPPVQAVVGAYQPCYVGEYADYCHSVGYATDFTQWNAGRYMDLDEIMANFAAAHELTVGLPGDADADVVRFDDEADMFEWCLEHPNVTEYGVVLHPPNTWQNGHLAANYALYYNQSLHEDYYGGDEWDLPDTPMLRRLQDTMQSAMFAAIVANGTGIAESDLAGNGYAYDIRSSTHPEVSPDTNWDAITSFGSLFFYVSIMFNFCLLLFQVTVEKEKQLRHGLYMVGLYSEAYWLSWVVFNVVVVFLYTMLIMLLGNLMGFAFFTKCSFWVNFLNFFSFGIAMTPIAFALSMTVSRGRQAINIGMIVFVVGVFLQIIFSVPFIIVALYAKQFQSTAVKVIRNILQFYPPFNFAKALSDVSLVANERTIDDPDYYFEWSDFNVDNVIAEGEDEDGDGEPDGDEITTPATWVSVRQNLLLIAVYSFVAWFFYNMMASEKGLGPLFFLRPSWWGIGKTVRRSKPLTEEVDADVVAEAERVKADASIDVRILELHKRFRAHVGRNSKADVIAVKSVTYGVSRGECLCILGHNGAGKTTTINMMVGMFRPTTGDVKVMGKSAVQNPDAVHSVYGSCPQHDILWPELTANEHLRIFGKLKGVYGRELKAQMAERLEDVLLTSVGNKAAGTYSGGMKRRLSVAMSAMGEPKVILLDEPTTGLDPSSRRHIWNAVQKYKKNAAIILTTHSMEEADILGDRIAIMAYGVLRCIGTGLHLKDKFGTGYRFTIHCADERIDELMDFVDEELPHLDVLAQSGGHMVIAVPTAELPDMVPFFEMLERRAEDDDFVVTDWGLSQTTLEEVFLSVTRDADYNPGKLIKNKGKSGGGGVKKKKKKSSKAAAAAKKKQQQQQKKKKPAPKDAVSDDEEMVSIQGIASPAIDHDSDSDDGDFRAYSQPPIVAATSSPVVGDSDSDSGSDEEVVVETKKKAKKAKKKKKQQQRESRANSEVKEMASMAALGPAHIDESDSDDGGAVQQQHQVVARAPAHVGGDLSEISDVSDGAAADPHGASNDELYMHDEEHSSSPVTVPPTVAVAGVVDDDTDSTDSDGALGAPAMVIKPSHEMFSPPAAALDEVQTSSSDDDDDEGPVNNDDVSDMLI